MNFKTLDFQVFSKTATNHEVSKHFWLSENGEHRGKPTGATKEKKV